MIKSISVNKDKCVHCGMCIKDCPQETLTKLADTLAFTPKGGNVNALYFSIVSTREKMRAVSELTYKKLPEINSPTAKFFVEEHANGNDFVFRNAPAMIAVSYVLLMGLPAVKYHRTTQPEPANVKII